MPYDQVHYMEKNAEEVLRLKAISTEIEEDDVLRRDGSKQEERTASVVTCFKDTRG